MSDIIGIFALNNDPKGTLLACPAKTIGHVSIHAYGKRIKCEESKKGNRRGKEYKL